MLSKTYWGGCCGQNCFNCESSEKHQAQYNYPHEPDEPAYAECTDIKVDESLLEKYNESELPKHCGHYKPVVVNEKCPNCGTPIHANEYEHPYWFTFYEPVPCCSEECVNIMEKGAEEYETKMNKQLL